MDDGLPVMSDDVTSTDAGDEDVKMGNVLTVDSEIPSSNKMESSTCTRAIKHMLEELKVFKIAYVNHT